MFFCFVFWVVVLEANGKWGKAPQAHGIWREWGKSNWL
jgi:hypothetical protein